MENYKAYHTSSSDRMLLLLKTKGPLSTNGIAQELGITGEGARQQLQRLAEEGWVVFESISRGVGRPSLLWSLSEKGNRRFPDSHAELTVQLINTIRDVLGDEALGNVISAREYKVLLRYHDEIKDEEGLEAKVRKFTELRSRDGYLAEYRREGEGFVMTENHCPICAAANACHDICKVELSTFQQIFKEWGTIERMDHVLEGARHCAYRIMPV
ncbi:helix-turn-helix transcriptional regulator [Chitinophaga sp. GCM10012297]|uniref:Transcriptional regulator n=1 Tax=Chitinophaga chungangae TaxID=2821488 RepID=A0ABS3YAT3_9BACT|nr:metalloregulator ArsR/SmtB family transcription factor [Chitinophaga chungangae]MBO9151787.1 transcriptional regulator [Chitinophaga chungangae]